MHQGEYKKERKRIETYCSSTPSTNKIEEASSFYKEALYEVKNVNKSKYGNENGNEKRCQSGGNEKERSDGIKKDKQLYLRKEIFDAAIIYTTNKMEETTLLYYLRNFYEYVKMRKKKSEKDLNEEIFINFEDWLSYNELINNQDSVLSTIFSVNMCKALWTLLSITVQSVKKKSNENKQKTIFNTNMEELSKLIHSENSNKGSNTTDWNANGILEKTKSRESDAEKSRKEQLFSKYDKYAQKKKEEQKEESIEENKEENICSNVWNAGWQNEMIPIELVLFFIILQFHKIDNVKKKCDRSLSEDCWPNYMDSPRSTGSSSYTSISTFNNLQSSFNRQNLSDFFSCSVSGNCKQFLKSFLIVFLASTDVINNNTLSDMPLYFKNSSFFLLDFIIDTNDEMNVYQTFLQKKEYKILYKTKTILNWLIENLCIQEEATAGIPAYQSLNSLSVSMYSGPTVDSFFGNIGIEQMKNEIYEIKNVHGKCIYVNEEKKIIHISNCRDCSIFILCNVECLRINICVDCYVICLSVEMIATLLNSTNIDLHLVARNLKIENAIDCNIYIYTETHIIISGDTRNIQLAPYNILNSKQKSCLEKSCISFNEKNCILFGFPLNCKTNFCSLNLSSNLKTSSSKGSAALDINRGGVLHKSSFTFKTKGDDKTVRTLSTKSQEYSVLSNNNLSSSMTDYMYYWLNPTGFYLIELSDNLMIKEEKEEEKLQDNGNEKNKNVKKEDCNQLPNSGMLTRNLESGHTREQSYDHDDIRTKANVENLLNGKVTSNMSSYINNNAASERNNNKSNSSYMCLFLPEIYKKAIENQDKRVISFLNFMNSIKLANSQKQKLTKILAFKLYEFIKKTPKTFRVLNDLAIKEQEKVFNLEWSGSPF